LPQASPLARVSLRRSTSGDIEFLSFICAHIAPTAETGEIGETGKNAGVTHPQMLV